MAVRQLLLLAALAGVAYAAQPQQLLGGAGHDLRASHMLVLKQAQANPMETFRAWVQSHAKEYLDRAEEYEKRFKIWLSNLEYIVQYNAKRTSHWLHLNSMADLTTEEFKARYLGYDASKRQANSLRSTPFRYKDVDPASLPQEIDWRAQGAVTEVKNQGMCGSCWAFATTGAVEGVNYVVTKELLSLSEQELVDCDRDQDKGCSGGLMDYAYQWIIDNGGIDTEEDYPYQGTEGTCVLKKQKRKVVTIDGYEDVPENDEVSLKKAAAHHPVAVAIEADAKSFQLYGGGVYDDTECGTALNHGVLVVGYGRDKAQGTYWVVKNSWGAEWGDQGYIKLKMGVDAAEGLCGIAMAASYPTKKGPNPPKPGPEPGPDPGPKPGPSPEPVKCDDDNECPAETTCCCVMPMFGMCFQWGCCPMEGAVCCDDNEHCCPSDLPVCDTDGGRCLPGKVAGMSDAEALALAQPAMKRTSAAKRTRSWVERIFGRGWSCGMHGKKQE